MACDRLGIHLHPSGENLTVDPTAEGVAQVCERLRLLRPKLVALEATGGLETTVARGLSTSGLPTVMVKLAQVRAFAHALGQRAKTYDAVIARFAVATHLSALDPVLRPSSWLISSRDAVRSLA